MGSVTTLKNIINLKKNRESYLIKRSISGDKESFGELIKEHKIYLYKIAYSYVKDEDNSLEIIQECSYRAMLNIKKLKKPDYFKTWITRIVINCSLDFINKNKTIWELGDNVKTEDAESRISVDEKLDLYNAIDLLRDNYKTVIILKYFNDMTIENISKVMETPENTVKTYLRRAKDNLSEILKEGYLND